MGQIDPELSRTQRLAEEREQRRRVVTSTVAGAVIVVIIAILAVTRLGASDPQRVAVLGAHESSVAPASTTLPAPSTTTAAPTTTTTTGGVLPGLGALLATTTTAAAPTSTTAVTPPPVGGSAVIDWTITPAVSLPSGAQANVDVTATNHGTATGSAITPGCPSAPVAIAPTPQPPAPDSTCTQGGVTVVLAPGASHHWSVPMAATNDGTMTGKPLVAGHYAVAIQGVPGQWVSLTVG